MHSSVEKLKYQALTKNQKTFLNSIIQANDYYFIEIKWIMAFENEENKRKLADDFSRIFTLKDGQLEWAKELRIFIRREDKKSICEKHFKRLKQEEKTEDYFSFIFSYISFSLLFRFNDEKSESNLHQLFYLLARETIANNDRALHTKSSDFIKGFFSTWLDYTSNLSKPLSLENYNKKLNELTERTALDIFVANKFGFSSPYIMLHFFLKAMELIAFIAVLYFIGTENITLAGLSGFSILPLQVFTSLAYRSASKKHAQFKQARAVQAKEISEGLKKDVYVELSKYINENGEKQTYHKIEFKEDKSSVGSVVSSSSSNQALIANKPVSSDLTRQRRVRPKSSYKPPQVINDTPKTSGARILEALAKQCPVAFKEKNIIELPNGMHAVLDKEAIRKGKPACNEGQVSAIKGTFKNSNGRSFLEKDGRAANGIKPSFSTAYADPYKSNEQRISHSYIKNLFSGVRVHGSVYHTEEGDVVVSNKASPK